jgi:hypothetical protein
VKDAMQKRFKAGETHIIKKLSTAMRTDYYDKEQEAYKTSTLGQYIQTVKDIRTMAKDDDDLASAMAGAKI